MRKLALFSAGFALAAALFVYLQWGRWVLWPAGICLVLSPCCLRLGLGRCCAVLLGLAAGLLWCFGYGEIRLGPADRACGNQQVICAVLLDSPEETAYGSRAVVEVSLEEKNYRAMLYGEENLMAAKPGDQVRCLAQIKSSLSREDQENRFYHRSAGTMLLLYAQSEPELQSGTPTWTTALRLWFQKRICSLYGEEISPLLLALLTGDQRNLSYARRNDLSVAGLSHVVSVSGLHVAVLLSALAMCFGYHPRLTALFGIPVLLAFVLMTGAAPSACRAAVMQILMITAPLVRRENDPWTNLSAASLLLLMENPWSIADVGFQLSFAAVSGLLLFSSPLQKRLLGQKKRPGFLWNMAVSGIAACLSATVATLPLTTYYFGILSLCAVLTNLLTLWAVNIMLILGLASCLLGGMGTVLALPVTVLSHYVLWLVETAARFPYGAAYLSNVPLMVWGVCAYVLATWLLLREKPLSFWPLTVMTAAFLTCILWGRWEYGHNAPVYRILDVGQGQCVLLELGELTAVVDCGGEYPEEAGEIAARTLHSGGQTHVDILALTHYDSDHAGGAEQLLHRVSVGMVLLPDVPDERGVRAAIEKAAEEAGSRVLAISSLTKMSFRGGEITVYPPCFREDENNGGICVLATAEEYDILITGDLDQMAELRLLSHWDLPEVEVLAAGHHGAKTSTGTTLLEVTHPQYVAISVGAGNPYGHPARETLERILHSGAEIIRTDEAGTIVLRRR